MRHEFDLRRARSHEEAASLLAAEVTGSRSRELRTVPIESFFVLPSQRLDAETILRSGEFVSAIVLSAAAAAHSVRAQHYYKAMQRGTWDFALVSLAAVKRADGTCGWCSAASRPGHGARPRRSKRALRPAPRANRRCRRLRSVRFAMRNRYPVTHTKWTSRPHCCEALCGTSRHEGRCVGPRGLVVITM